MLHGLVPSQGGISKGSIKKRIFDAFEERVWSLPSLGRRGRKIAGLRQLAAVVAASFLRF